MISQVGVVYFRYVQFSPGNGNMDLSNLWGYPNLRQLMVSFVAFFNVREILKVSPSVVHGWMKRF